MRELEGRVGPAAGIEPAAGRAFAARSAAGADPGEVALVTP
jgi:hypothetical protein